MITGGLILGLVTLQRLGELVLARRNTARLFKRGAVEYAPEHYPLIVLLHAAWLATLWIVGFDQPVSLVWLGVYALLQVLRVWVLVTLGERWTTRILLLPGAPAVVTGPFRFVRHPNYLVVVGEIAVLPLALDLPIVAAIFSILNGGVLAIRIKAENRAWREGSPGSGERA
jgi:methyltransferase